MSDRRDAAAGAGGAGVVVAIVSYNVRPLLERSVASALAAVGELPDGGRVVVVDNASADGSADMVRHRYGQVRVIANSANVGFGAACNQALEAAGEVSAILFLNPDAELLPGALPALHARLASTPAAAVVGPRVTYPDGSPQPTRRRFPAPTTLFLESTPLEWRGPRWRSLARYRWLGAPETAGRVDWLSGACLHGRTSALREVGGFDPLFFMYFEELDLSRRLAARGWETWYEPAARAIHHHGQSAGQDPAARDRYYYASKYRYAARYFGATVARLLRWSGAAQFAAEWAVQRRRGATAQARRYAALTRWHLARQT